MFATVWHELPSETADQHAAGITHALVCHGEAAWTFRTSPDNFKLSVHRVALDRDEVNVTALASSTSCQSDRLVIADQRGDVIM